MLCGALTWATPTQRMFYGIIGTAAAVYSVVSVNLGGFIIGLLLGIFGGALSIAWVPDKRVIAEGVDHTEPDDEDVTTDFGAELPAYVGEDHDQWRDPDVGESEEQEGEQREPFRQPRHAADDEPEPVIPAARTAPDTDPTITNRPAASVMAPTRTRRPKTPEPTRTKRPRRCRACAAFPTCPMSEVRVMRYWRIRPRASSRPSAAMDVATPALSLSPSSR